MVNNIPLLPSSLFFIIQWEKVFCFASFNDDNDDGSKTNRLLDVDVVAPPTMTTKENDLPDLAFPTDKWIANFGVALAAAVVRSVLVRSTPRPARERHSTSRSKNGLHTLPKQSRWSGGNPSWTCTHLTGWSSCWCKQAVGWKEDPLICQEKKIDERSITNDLKWNT